MQQLMEGLPQHVKKLPLALRPFWQLRNDLAIEHSCITYQGRLYIPTVLRPNMMKALHQGHPGIVKMKLRAKSAVYWMGLNKEIEEHVFKCEPCQIHGRSQQKEPAIPIEIPNTPWQKNRYRSIFFTIANGTSLLLITIQNTHGYIHY